MPKRYPLAEAAAHISGAMLELQTASALIEIAASLHNTLPLPKTQLEAALRCCARQLDQIAAGHDGPPPPQPPLDLPDYDDDPREADNHA